MRKGVFLNSLLSWGTWFVKHHAYYIFTLKTAYHWLWKNLDISGKGPPYGGWDLGYGRGRGENSPTAASMLCGVTNGRLVTGSPQSNARVLGSVCESKVEGICNTLKCPKQIVCMTAFACRSWVKGQKQQDTEHDKTFLFSGYILLAMGIRE